MTPVEVLKEETQHKMSHFKNKPCGKNDLPSMCNIFCKQSKILQEGMSTSCELVCDILCILCMSMKIFFFFVLFLWVSFGSEYIVKKYYIFQKLFSKKAVTGMKTFKVPSKAPFGSIL